MPSEFRCRLNAALEVTPPSPPIAAIRSRASHKAHRETLLRRGIAALALTIALGGVSLTAAHHGTPTPNPPQPIASSSPAPAFT